MKTKIIFLDAHDDLISVRDKLSWAKTPRILLIWPKYEKIPLRLLDLKILQRHADALGAQLGLVTRRLHIRRDAEALGIPVFKSASAAQKEAWPEVEKRVQRIPPSPRRDLRDLRKSVYIPESAWRTSRLGRISMFTLGVLAVLAVAGIFIPRAKITLAPELQIHTAVIPVSASPQIETISFAGEVPIRMISLIVGGEESTAISSSITIPKDPAVGIIRFTNLTQRAIEIPAGTEIASSSLARYRTLTDGILPAGVNEFIEIQIQALEAGVQGNAEAGTIQTVAGLLGLSVFATNPQAVAGGSDSSAIGASDDDRAELREKMLNGLRQSAQSQLSTKIHPGDIVLPDTLEEGEILQEEFSPPQGQAGRSLLLKMQMELSARYIAQADLEQLAAFSLTSSVPDGFLPFDSPAFELLSEPAVDAKGGYNFQIQAEQVFVQKIDEINVFSVIRGQDSLHATSALKAAFQLREEPQISILPSWWPWLPIIPFNVSLELK